VSFKKKKMVIYRQVYVTKKTLVIIIICYILWEKYGTMFIRQYQSRIGKKKVIANEEKGRRGRGKDAHLNTPSLMCRGSHTTVSANENKKKRQKRQRGLCTDPNRVNITQTKSTNYFKVTYVI